MAHALIIFGESYVTINLILLSIFAYNGLVIIAGQVSFMVIVHIQSYLDAINMQDSSV